MKKLFLTFSLLLPAAGFLAGFALVPSPNPANALLSGGQCGNCNNNSGSYQCYLDPPNPCNCLGSGSCDTTEIPQNGQQPYGAGTICWKHGNVLCLIEYACAYGGAGGCLFDDDCSQTTTVVDYTTAPAWVPDAAGRCPPV